MAKHYVDGKSIPQVIELIKKYEPDLLWFNASDRMPLSENLRLLRAIREIAPDVVINGWLANTEDFPSLTDYAIPVVGANTIDSPGGPWEIVLITNDAFGYSKVDKAHRPPEFFIRALARCAARGGNVMLNLGPDALGRIDGADLAILAGVGAWMKVNGESIYGTSRSPLCRQPFGEITRKGNTLYLHVFERGNGTITLAGVVSHITKAWLLADKDQRPLSVRRINYYDTEITLPEGLPDSCDTVIAAEYEGELLYGENKRPLDARTEAPEPLPSAGKTSRTSKREELTRKINQYIEERYVDGTLRELAKLLSYDKIWLSKVVQQLTGSSFKQLQQSRRVAQAKHLLDTTDLPVSDIAKQVGYNDTSHFYQLFKKLADCSPAEYRAKK